MKQSFPARSLIQSSNFTTQNFNRHHYLQRKGYSTPPAASATNNQPPNCATRLDRLLETVAIGCHRRQRIQTYNESQGSRFSLFGEQYARGVITISPLGTLEPAGPGLPAPSTPGPLLRTGSSPEHPQTPPPGNQCRKIVKICPIA